MAIKKFTLNEIRSIINQIIKETYNDEINLNDNKFSDGAFEDYDFRYRGDHLQELVITYKFKPSVELVKKDLEIIKNRYKEGSIYNLFEPKLGIIYLFVYGWDTGFNFFLTIDVNSEFVNRPFPDEPTGKYKKMGRKVFRL